MPKSNIFYITNTDQSMLSLFLLIFETFSNIFKSKIYVNITKDNIDNLTAKK